MPKIKLTAPVVAKLEPEEGKAQSYFWDDGCDGLVLRVSKTSRSYAFEARFSGQTVRIAIGDPKTWALGDARALAREYSLLIDKGIDPRVYRANLVKAQQDELESARQEVAQAKIEEARNEILTRTVWDAYLADRRDDWGERHYMDHVNLSQPGGEPKKRGKGLSVPGALAPVMSHPIASIDAEFLADWLKAESKTRPTGARKAFELMSVFWAWAVRHKEFGELITAPLLFSDLDLKRSKPQRKAARGDDVLEKEHLGEWFKAVQGIESNREVSVFLQLMLLCGTRRNELLDLRWEHLTARAPANIWVHDKVDGDVGRHVPLGPYALYLLNSLPKRQWVDESDPDEKKRLKDVAWVFSGPRIGNARIHHDTPGAVHARALVKAGLPHIEVYSLRKTYTTLAEWIEMPAGVTAQIQGHKSSAVQERHYKRRPISLLSQWHCRFESWILEQAGIEFDADTVKGGLRIIK